MKNSLYKMLKIIGLFNFLKQLKIDYMSVFKRDTNIDFIDLSHLPYKEAGYKLARLYKDSILNDMPIDYSEEVVKSYELLSQLDKNIVEELDAISEYLQIDKYLLLAKDLLFVPEACTSVSIKDKHNTYIGQNLDLGYDGSNLLVKKYKDYITVGLKNHPLWSTVGINKYGISFSGSSVNSKHYGGELCLRCLIQKLYYQNVKIIKML